MKNILSLFDGISCCQVALKGIIEYDTYYASEIEEDAIKVTQSNFPNTIQLGDVTKLTSYPKDIELLAGGSPCQSLSRTITNNKQLDGKSKLFWEYVRIKNELQPTYFLFENVIAKQETLKIMNEALGCEPILLNSEHFSPQSRPRYYWTNIPVTQVTSSDSRVIKDILDTQVAEKYFYKETFDILDMSKSHLGNLHINGHDLIKRIRSIHHKSPTLTAVCGGNQQIKILDGDRVRKLTPSEYEKLQGLPVGYTSCVSDTSRYKAIGNGWQVDTIRFILKGATK